MDIPIRCQGYRYNGEDIEEAIDAELTDRGFTSPDFLVINAGKTTLFIVTIMAMKNGPTQNLAPKNFLSLSRMFQPL